MAYQIGANVGFVTNSSSMVYHFPKTLLEHPAVKAFLTAFEIEDGFVGDNLWSRNACGTLAITRETKQAAIQNLESNGYEDFNGPGISMDENEFVVIYGDEHADIAYVLAKFLQDLAEKEFGLRIGGHEYN
jgi:hypothetical protein